MNEAIAAVKMAVLLLCAGFLLILGCQSSSTSARKLPLETGVTIPDDSLVITRDNTARVTQIGKWERFKGSGAIEVIAISSDDKHIASCSGDGTFEILEIQDAESIYREENTGHGLIRAVLFVKDRDEIVVGYQDGTLAERSLDGTMIWEGNLRPGLRRIAYSPAANMLAVVSHADPKDREGGLVQFVDLETGGMTDTLKGTGVDFVAGGNTFVLGTGSGQVELWDLTPPSKKSVLDKSNSGNTSVIVTPDGKMVSMNSNNPRSSGDIRLARIEDGRFITALWATKRILSAVYSPDSQIIATSTMQDSAIQLFGAADGYTLSRLRGHSRPVTCMCFSSNGKMIISGSADGTIRFWGIP